VNAVCVNRDAHRLVPPIRARKARRLRELIGLK
jgi:hypothetical protein